ncbi:hypothetical protein BD413DRAFT_135930 [Trametes elegans]|nr:hypothetical protein BD413DRAFT_135930 [Trametes elegans]
MTVYIEPSTRCQCPAGTCRTAPNRGVTLTQRPLPRAYWQLLHRDDVAVLDNDGVPIDVERIVQVQDGPCARGRAHDLHVAPGAGYGHFLVRVSVSVGLATLVALPPLPSSPSIAAPPLPPSPPIATSLSPSPARMSHSPFRTTAVREGACVTCRLW